jgi:Domain of unknown function (DUF1844)
VSAEENGNGNGEEDLRLSPLPRPSGDEAPEIDFVTFVLSLSSTAMIQLGEIEGPEGSGLDLVMARHSIEILQILDEKTRGNLTGEEEQVLHHVLDDLRARYLSKRG